MISQFSATKRITRSRLGPTRGTPHRSRDLRWLALLSVTTVLLVIWLVWRFLLAAASFDTLPQAFIESLNLLTFSSAATVGLLWALLAYQRRLALPPVAPSRSDLQALSPAEFEQFAAELFRAQGYTVRLRGRSGDLGVDLEIVNAVGKKAIAQCKRYRSTVGPDVVRELYGTMIHERVSHAFLVTTADISDGAREWASGKPITLLDGDTLVELSDSKELQP